MYVILFIACFLFYKPSMQYSGRILQMEDVTVQVGDGVTFHCFHPQDEMNRVMWYKQTLTEKPTLVASSYFWTQKSVLYDEFKKSKRFKTTASVDSFNLTIQRPVQSDLATYFCAGSFSNIVYFGAGTTLVLRGSNSDKILRRPQHEMTFSSGNVTLQCTIHIKQESCGGKHKVYWLKHTSGETHPRIIYTQESCKDPETASPDKRCVYSLSVRNIGPSVAGTYYCAVDTCGEILFGQGIYLAFDDESKIQSTSFFFLIGLAVLMTVSFICNVVLCVTRKKGNTSQQVHTADVMSSVQFSSTADVNYAALKFTTQNSRKQKEDSQKETEYSELNL